MMQHSPPGFPAALLALATAPALAAAPVPVMPATAQALYIAGVAASCANCHGTGGHPQPGSALPPLAGQPAARTLARLRAFQQAGTPSTVMQQLSAGFSDPQLQDLAAYFAAQRP